MSQPHPTPQTHHSPNANPNVTAQKTADLTKRCACAVKSSSTLQPTSCVSTRFLATSHESDPSRFHPKPSPKASPNGSALALYCGQLQRAQNGPKSFQTCGVVQLVLKLTLYDLVTFRGRRSTLCGTVVEVRFSWQVQGIVRLRGVAEVTFRGRRSTLCACGHVNFRDWRREW